MLYTSYPVCRDAKKIKSPAKRTFIALGSRTSQRRIYDAPALKYVCTPPSVAFVYFCVPLAYTITHFCGVINILLIKLSLVIWYIYYMRNRQILLSVQQIFTIVNNFVIYSMNFKQYLSYSANLSDIQNKKIYEYINNEVHTQLPSLYLLQRWKILFSQCPMSTYNSTLEFISILTVCNYLHCQTNFNVSPM